MTAPFTGWRVSFAEFSVVLISLVLLGSVALMWWRVDRWPIKGSGRTKSFYTISCMGGLFSLLFPLEEIMPMPCWVHYVMTSCLIPFWGMPLILSYVRYYREFQIQHLMFWLARGDGGGEAATMVPSVRREEMKRDIDNSRESSLLQAVEEEEEEGGDEDMWAGLRISEQLNLQKSSERLLVKLKLSSKRNTMTYAWKELIVSIVVYITATLFLQFITADTVDEFGFCIRSRTEVAFDTVMASVCLMVVARMVILSRRLQVHDEYGVLRDFLLATFFVFVEFVLFLCLLLLPDQQLYKDVVTVNYVVNAMILTSIGCIVLRPALRTFPIFSGRGRRNNRGGPGDANQRPKRRAGINRRPRLSESQQTLDYVLAGWHRRSPQHDLYVLFLEHLKGEFSVENILFWKEVMLLRHPNLCGDSTSSCAASSSSNSRPLSIQRDPALKRLDTIATGSFSFDGHPSSGSRLTAGSPTPPQTQPPPSDPQITVGQGCELFNKFLRPDAIMQVNVPATQVKNIAANLGLLREVPGSSRVSMGLGLGPSAAAPLEVHTPCGRPSRTERMVRRLSSIAVPRPSKQKQRALYSMDPDDATALVPVSVFDATLKEIFQVMERDSWRRFKNSDRWGQHMFKGPESDGGENAVVGAPRHADRLRSLV